MFSGKTVCFVGLPATEEERTEHTMLVNGEKPLRTYKLAQHLYRDNGSLETHLNNYVGEVGVAPAGG